MHLVAGRFTAATAQVGNDLSTLPDFPAEIRAPAGTPHGVSAFQIHFASRDILTPGDHPNTLVAMNPAALRSHLAALEPGGTLIVNEDAFTEPNLRKAGYEENPLDDASLDGYRVIAVEPDLSPALHEGLRAGRPVSVTPRSAADALSAPFAGGTAIEVCRALGVESVLVSEAELVDAFRWLYTRTKLACALGAATAVPARVIGADAGRIAVGAPADLVVLSAELEIERVLLGGEVRVAA